MLFKGRIPRETAITVSFDTCMLVFGSDTCATHLIIYYLFMQEYNRTGSAVCPHKKL